MKNLLLVSLLLPLASHGQVSCDFESGVATGWVYNYPDRWIVDSDSPLNGLWSLHHAFDNSEPGCDIAAIDISSVRADLDTVRWQFSIRHGYDPSSSNNWGIYLASDGDVTTMFPGGNSSGFVIGVNMTGYDDTLRLWRMDEGSPVKVITTFINWQNDVGEAAAAFLRVTRAPGGNWRVSIGVDGAAIKTVGEGYDGNWYPAAWFGICYRYTSTRDRLLWFDDLLVNAVFIADTIPPKVMSAGFCSHSRILVELDEDIHHLSLDPDNFTIDETGISPSNVEYPGKGKLYLNFSESMENKSEYSLVIKAICDNHGNCTGNLFIPVLLAVPEWGDLVITEFMADPEPAVHLPECEYVEIYNRTRYEFNLESAGLLIGNRSVQMPYYILSPGDYVVICDDVCDLSGHPLPAVIKLDGFPPIANSGVTILLTDTSGYTIHGLEYTDSWKNDALKSDGGWAMEILDRDYPFHYDGNWKYSVSGNGGTPGGLNSVSSANPDYIYPWLDNVFPLSDTLIRVDFSEPVDIPGSAEDYISISNIDISSVSESGKLRKSFNIYTSEKIDNGLIYEIDIQDYVTDFNNNKLDRSSLRFGITSSPMPGELVINEILFDALPWESEYIELYNNSERAVNASELFLVSVNLQTGDTGKPVMVSRENRCIMPGDYYAITTDKHGITERYNSSEPYNIYEVDALPSLPDDEGTLIIYSREGIIIDRVNYSKEMHFDLLAGTEGISLERVSPGAPSDSRGTWHSASGTSGWGTPGAKNSIYMDTLPSDNKVTLSSRRISPDNDGNEDILKITLRLDDPGYIVRCRIFNDLGHPVREIGGYTTAGISSDLYWDGTADDGSLLPGGIYIVMVKITGRKGEVSAIKKACAIIR